METLIIASFTGLISSFATVVALKVDIRWLKEIQSEHSNRISSLESEVRAVVGNINARLDNA